MNINFRMFSKLKGYRRLKEERTEDEEKKYKDYKDNWVKKGDGKGVNEGYAQEEKKKSDNKKKICFVRIKSLIFHLLQ